MPNDLEICFTKKTSIRRNITDGILVLEEIMSKTDANNSKTESVIMIKTNLIMLQNKAIKGFQNCIILAFVYLGFVQQK